MTIPAWNVTIKIYELKKAVKLSGETIVRLQTCRSFLEISWYRNRCFWHQTCKRKLCHHKNKRTWRIFLKKNIYVMNRLFKLIQSLDEQNWFALNLDSIGHTSNFVWNLHLQEKYMWFRSNFSCGNTIKLITCMWQNLIFGPATNIGIGLQNIKII